MIRYRGSMAVAVALMCCACSQREAAAEQPQQTRSLATKLPIPNPYPEATQVRLLVEKAYGKDGRAILNDPAGHILKANERAALEAALFVSKAPDEVAACFIPHHFFRYLDKAGNEVGEIAVCFCCAGVAVSKDSNIVVGPDQILDADYDKLKVLVRQIGEPTDVLCD